MKKVTADADRPDQNNSPFHTIPYRSNLNIYEITQTKDDFNKRIFSIWSAWCMKTEMSRSLERREQVPHPTYQEIYQAIKNRSDFNEPQLFYLDRLVQRKLKSFNPRFDESDFNGKPYQEMDK